MRTTRRKRGRRRGEDSARAAEAVGADWKSRRRGFDVIEPFSRLGDDTVGVVAPADGAERMPSVANKTRVAQRALASFAPAPASETRLMSKTV